MKLKGVAILILVSSLIFISIFPSVGQASESVEPVITPVAPANNTTIWTHTPIIVANYSVSSAGSPIAIVYIDGVDVTNKLTSQGLPCTTINTNNITYTVNPDMALRDGQHNVSITLIDDSGAKSSINWTFFVETPPFISITIQQVVYYVTIGIGMVFGAIIIALIVLKRTRNFSLRKHLKKHPIPTRIIFIAIPAIVALFFIIIALYIFEGVPGASPFITEYILVIDIFIFLLPYGIYVQIEKKKKTAYEHAFSQFLYEMADAMRGGIDPSKAIIEMSKNDTSILKKHLKIAANGLEMGRPFEEMIEAMVKPIDSKLIKRYASLIGETAKIGGEIAQVVHRAAKDMDDLIKIDQDRGRSLSIQGTTIYISFGVLVVIVYLLISIYPSLGSADFGSIFSGFGSTSASSSTSSSANAVAPMTLVTLEQRFLDLTIITGLGSGIIIGLFTNGKAKYGLIHGLGMMLGGVIFLIIMM